MYFVILQEVTNKDTYISVIKMCSGLKFLKFDQPSDSRAYLEFEAHTPAQPAFYRSFQETIPYHAVVLVNRSSVSSCMS